MTSLTPFALTSEDLATPTAFHGRSPGGPQTEKPWHRNAAHLLASGLSAKDVADLCDVTPQTVTLLMKAPWFGERVNEIIARSGVGDIQKMLAGEALASVATLVDLRDGEKTPASVKATVAMDILNRVLGKPTQRVETVEVTTSEDPVAEAARLEKEIALLKGETHGRS